MEYLLFIAIVLALVEWREVKQRRRYRAIEAHLKRTTRQIESRLEADRLAVVTEIVKLRESIGPMEEFLRQAHTDLGTIVKEYELNGIPLNLQRGRQHFDMVEGL